MSRHKLLSIVLTILVLTGCTVEQEQHQPESVASNPPMKNLIARQISDMFRTKAAGARLTDLPTGNPIPSLQVENLEPGEYTIQFEGLPPVDGNGFSAYAIVTWKIGGQQITRKISVFSGAVITGVAEACDVKIVDVSDIVSTAQPPLPYKIAASLSKGTRPALMQPATLNTSPRNDTIPPADVLDWIIPQNAGVISALALVANRTDDGIVVTNPFSVAVIVRSSTGAELVTYYPLAQNPGWVPMPGNAVQLSIYNLMLAPAELRANVVWGIEG